jgi:homeobox-leucine zipper protein
VCQIRELRDKVEKQMAVRLESVEDRQPLPAAGAAAAVVYKDGSTDSDSSAVFNEEASPYSGGAAPFDHHTSFTGFTCLLQRAEVLLPVHVLRRSAFGPGGRRLPRRCRHRR